MKNLLLVASTTFVSLGFVFHSCNTEIKKLISLPTMWRMQSNSTQYKLTLLRKSGEILNPRTINTKGEIQYIPTDDWCSGFFQEVCGTYMRLQMTQNGKN